VIDNAHMDVKNSFIWKKRMSRVPGRRMQIMGSIIPWFYWRVWKNKQSCGGLTRVAHWMTCYWELHI